VGQISLNGLWGRIARECKRGMMIGGLEVSKKGKRKFGTEKAPRMRRSL
jgi:hypothetical protein